MAKKYIFVNSHPIQYFAPLYQYMVSQNMDVEVFYCSDETIKGAMDKEFGVAIKWDLPLLKGYTNSFVKNNSFSKGIHKGFWGLMNFGLWKALRKKEKAIVVVPGWQFFSYLLAIFVAKIYGHTVCLRVETPLSHKEAKKGFLQNIKNGILKFSLPKLIHYFLYIGEENKNYIKSFGIKDDRLFFTPYSVDNERFRNKALQYLPIKESLKNELLIPNDKFIILYSGKFIDKKKPLDLLEAVNASIYNKQIHIVYMGEGELRIKMEQFMAKNEMNNVLLTGFINQSEVSKFYAVSNLFVMCSGVGETWGLSANEAMNFGLPIVLSDLTGSSANLVQHGQNGFVFETGNITQLTNCINQAFEKFNNKDEIGCKKSLEIINEYSFHTIAKNMAIIPIS